MLKINQYKVISAFLLQAFCLSFLVLTSARAMHTRVPGVLGVISYSKFTPISYGVHGEGYEGDLLRAVARLWGMKIRFYPEAVYEGLWLLPSKKYTIADMAMGGMTPSRQRIEQGALFSKGTLTFNQSLLVRKRDYESGKIVSYESFKNRARKIGVVPGTTGALYAHLRARKNHLSDNIFVEYASESELLPALMQGKIDAIARGDIGNTWQESKNKALITIARKSFGENFAFSINNGNKELANKLNKAILQITNNGKISYAQWLRQPQIFTQRAEQLRTLSNAMI